MTVHKPTWVYCDCQPLQISTIDVTGVGYTSLEQRSLVNIHFHYWHYWFINFFLHLKYNHHPQLMMTWHFVNDNLLVSSRNWQPWPQCFCSFTLTHERHSWEPRARCCRVAILSRSSDGPLCAQQQWVTSAAMCSAVQPSVAVKWEWESTHRK